MTFGAQVEVERSARGLSKRALALRAGVSPAYATLLEQGRRSPARRVALALGRVLEAAPRRDGRPDPGVTARLLAAAGYAPGGPNDGVAPSPDLACPGAQFRAPAALAAALRDPELPPAARDVLDGLVCDVVAALRAATGGEATRRPFRPAGALRRAAVTALLAGRGEDEVRAALDDYRSPVYDL